ncbi:MAG: hypothetical protein ACO1Q7_09655 [Gemmatimonas sp.]
MKSRLHIPRRDDASHVPRAPRRRRSIVLARLTIAGLLLLNACDRAPHEPEEPAAQIAQVVIVDESAGGSVIYSHDDHWHGILRLRPSDTRPIKVYVVTAANAKDDHEAPLPAAWSDIASLTGLRLQATVSDSTIASWSGTGSTATISAKKTGATAVSFVVMRGGTTIHQSPAVGLSVAP